jgi:hypothetical protein
MRVRGIQRLRVESATKAGDKRGPSASDRILGIHEKAASRRRTPKESVAAGEVNLIEKVAAVEPSFQQLHEDVCLPDPKAITYGAGVGSDEQIWSSPQGAIWGKGLGARYIQSCASQRTGLQCA